MGICSPLIDWIADFFGRVMRVSVLGIRSRERLGQLLFLLFLNHLPTYVVSKCTFFEDDLKIYLKIPHGNIVVMLSSDLSSCQRDLGDCNSVLKNAALCVLYVRRLLSKD